MNLGTLFTGIRESLNPTQSPTQGNPAPVQGTPAPTQGGEAGVSALDTKQATQGNLDAQNLQNPPQPKENASPLAEFANLFKDDPKATPEVFQLLNADPTKISEVSSKINFTSSLNPEMVKKALAGDVNAFLAVINGVAQQSFATATQASSALVDRQSTLAIDHIKKTLPDQFKQFSVRTDMQAENPQFSNPAIQPLLSLIQERLATQYPDASPAELKQHAKKYFSGVVEVFAPGAKVPSPQDGEDGEAPFMQQVRRTQQNANDFDFEAWATGQSQQKQTSS